TVLQSIDGKPKHTERQRLLPRPLLATKRPALDSLAQDGVFKARDSLFTTCAAFYLRLLNSWRRFGFLPWFLASCSVAIAPVKAGIPFLLVGLVIFCALVMAAQPAGVEFYIDVYFLHRLALKTRRPAGLNRS